jgi:hypothetical protein
VADVEDLEAAWNELHDAVPPHWRVGRPVDNKPGERTMYAFDTRERSRRGLGHRTHEWIATATTGVGVVLEMARCLRVIGEGRWPE